jgi:hypothetical protein
MAVRWPWKSAAQRHDDGQSSLTVFYLAAVAGGFGIAAIFGYLAEVASSNGLLLHAAAHSFIAAFGAVTTAVIAGQSIKAGRT